MKTQALWELRCCPITNSPFRELTFKNKVDLTYGPLTTSVEFNCYYDTVLVSKYGVVHHLQVRFGSQG